MSPSESTPPYDVIIVGGSYAGLSCAMQLGRARRRVLVIDAGQRRNRYASHSHGFSDAGRPGARRDCRRRQAPGAGIRHRQLARGQGVPGRRKRQTASSSRLDDGGTVQASRLVLASGVVDELPPVEGLRERWGASAFHCPYCHGYELDQGQHRRDRQRAACRCTMR